MAKQRDTKKTRAVVNVKDNETTSNAVPARKPLWIPIVFLIAINLLAYAPVSKNAFVNYDDPGYVYANPQVLAGLTWNGVLWAFTTSHQANWHPLTWLSHMLDVQLFGLNASRHHLTNLCFHIGNTLLLFWVLFQMTGALGRSSFVAALFGVHPLHVQSVAWVAERKDVLSTFFAMLTILAYILWVRRPRWSRYAAVAILLALGLMAKPMLVTLPFLLLLLDFWPLGRLMFKPRSNFAQLVREKIPLLILGASSSAVTLIVQDKGGAMAGSLVLPVATRVANAFVAYCSYVWKMFYPANLIVLYPIRVEPAEGWFVAAIAVVGLSILALVSARRRPYLPVGWFWFLGTLVPVIGLVQVGTQSMADRYTYVPFTGLFLIVAFGFHDALGARLRQVGLVSAGALAIAACIWISRTQVSYWRDSAALWRHQLSVSDIPFGRLSLGNSLATQGKPEEAITQYSEALRLQPQYGEAHYALAQILATMEKTDEAIRHYSEVIRLVREGKAVGIRGERLAKTYYDLGLALARKGNPDDAAAMFNEALQINPNFAEAHHDLGAQLLIRGKLQEAITHFSQAIRLSPQFAAAHNSLGTALASQGRIDEAINEVTEAVRLDARYSDAHANLGILLASEGRNADAIAQFNEALHITPDHQAAQAWLANLTRKNGTKQ